MRVLLVSHDFLPNHPAGTEIYTYQFGRKLAARGHDVHVFTTEKDISLPHLSVRFREYGGLPVHELINNLFYKSFRETWSNEPVARTFAHFLDQLRPDVVHFMHLMYLSVGCVESAAERVPVFFTLHDYWLQCARFGQRVHVDRSICHRIEFTRCGQCMSRFKYGQTSTERRLAKGIALARQLTGVDLGPRARRWFARWRRSADVLRSAPPGSLRMPEGEQPPAPALDSLQPEERRMHGEIAVRDEALRQRVLPAVTRFVAPSQFLRQSFVDWGVPEEQIVHLRTGIDLDPFRGFERRRAAKLRIGFIGTIVPHKGVHVLLRAWSHLAPQLRERAELAIYGPTDYTPAYVNAVRALAGELGVELRGRLQSEEVPRALGSIDLLVVPSVWYENSPLIILEALATRTPLLVSNLGGMAELVQPGVSGFRFEVGDDVDLGHRLRLILEEPEQLARLFTGELPVQSVERDAEFLEQLYSAAVRERAAGAEDRPR
jgi:glycosyltransferase involved in cell wall biosynthesis